jgi:hypothetical protein
MTAAIAPTTTDCLDNLMARAAPFSPSNMIFMRCNRRLTERYGMQILVRFCRMLESPPKSCRLSMCPYSIGLQTLIDLLDRTDLTAIDPPGVVSIGALISLAADARCFYFYRRRSSGNLLSYLPGQHLYQPVYRHLCQTSV